MMMPPKKSKAARSDNIETNEVREKEPESDSHSEDEAARPKSRDDGPAPEKNKKEHFNMFDITTMEGKRRRSSTKPEDSAMDWIVEHMEAKEDKKLPLGDVYNLYLEKCVSEARNAVESNLFYRAVWKEFPKGFGFKGDSPHLEVVKEVKVKKKEPKVKADTLNLKIRTIIEDSLTDMGNPERGIGKCGFYRRFVDGEPAEEEKEKPKDGEKKEGKEGEESKKDDSSPKEEEEGAEKKEDEGDEKKDVKKKKAAKKPKKTDRVVHHASPTHLEDTFYLAMTFMCEPKEASVVRIKKYISENYPESKVDRLGKCLDTGKEKGYWEQVTGTSGNAGTFRLEVDSFDPTDDEDMTGMVINAIMACTEPKTCSANLLKKFVLEWHSEKFKVAERPHLFKKALERAVSGNVIRQLSGIGASGTFQLTKPFCPSPVILAGQDTLSDYEDDGAEDESSEDEGGLKYDYAGYGDKYVPRPSKRRGKARTQAVCAKPAVEINLELAKKKKRKASRMAIGRKRYAGSDSSEEESSSEEEESSEEEPEPVKKKSRAAPNKKAKAAKPKAKATPARRGRRKAETESDASDSEEEEAPKKSRGKAANNVKKEPKKRKRPSYKADTSSSEDDEEKIVDGYRPTPSRSRGGASARTPVVTPKKPAKKTPARKGRKSEEPAPKVQTPAAKKQGIPKYVASDSEDESYKKEPMNTGGVQTPAAKKQGSRPAPKSRGRRK